MCGICGMLRPSRPMDGQPDEQEAEIRSMTTALAHRGPDGQGIHVRGPVALGHARLAIIDTSPAGAQPMLDENGRLAVAVSGSKQPTPW